MSKHPKRQLLLAAWIAGAVLGRGFPVAADQVIPDDLIVQGSICVGLDCVNNENFDFDTLRLKENNTRINFNDTSVTPGFATRNWQVRANASGGGGLAFLGIVDQGNDGAGESGTVVFAIEAGAPADAMRVSNSGRVGIRTGTPALDLHIKGGNTPSLRLEQDSTSGFTAQTWDIAGNEANFFVRDTTGGSRLPFRIVSGAPTNSIVISPIVSTPGEGGVGIGTNLPATKLHVKGDTTLEGDFSVLSSRSAKEHFKPVDPDDILVRLAELPLSEWSYKGGTGARHMGPVAEDFHAAFPLGKDDRSINPLDVAGVALAGIQSLNSELGRLASQSSETQGLLAEREHEIALLKQDRQLLEERLGTLETVVQELLNRAEKGDKGTGT